MLICRKNFVRCLPLNLSINLLAQQKKSDGKKNIFVVHFAPHPNDAVGNVSPFSSMKVAALVACAPRGQGEESL